MSERIKCKIEQVGTVDADGCPAGWGFIGSADAVGIEYASDGEVYFGGYTVDELRKIVDARRRYIFQWRPLPLPPWGKSKEEARQLAIDALWRENIMSRSEAAAFVDAHGAVVEVQQ